MKFVGCHWTNPPQGQSSSNEDNTVAREWGEYHPSQFDSEKRLTRMDTRENELQLKKKFQQIMELGQNERNLEYEEWKKRVIERDSDRWREEAEKRQKKMEEDQNRLLQGFKSEPDCAHANFPVTIVEEGDQLYSITSVEEYNNYIERMKDEVEDKKSESSDSEMDEEAREAEEILNGVWQGAGNLRRIQARMDQIVQERQPMIPNAQ